MTLITLKLTIEELELLTTLAADQIFRREFIDPRMPAIEPTPKRWPSVRRWLLACD